LLLKKQPTYILSEKTTISKRIHFSVIPTSRVGVQRVESIQEAGHIDAGCDVTLVTSLESRSHVEYDISIERDEMHVVTQAMTSVL